MKSSALVILALSLSTLVGCAASTEDSMDSEGAFTDGETSTLKATLTSHDLQKSDQKCSVSATVLEVSGVSTAHAINDALAEAPLAAFADVDCADEAFHWESTMTAQHNGNGFLSISELGYTSYEGAAHDAKFVKGHNFDLASGEKIAMKDLLTSAGLTKAIALCSSGISTIAGDYADDVDDSYETPCRSAIEEEYGPVTYTFDAQGIRVHPSLGTAAFVVEAEGALLAWSELEGELSELGRAVHRATK